MTLRRRTPLRWLIPRRDEPGRDLARRIKLTLTLSLVLANVLGALIVVALGLLVVPLPGIENDATTRAVTLAVAGAYLLAFVPIGSWWGLKRLRAARKWLEDDRPPTEDERRVVLRAPRRIVVIHVLIWSLAAIVFGGINAAASLEAGVRIFSLVVVAGLVTCAFVYLIAERQLRPAAARALATGGVEQRLAPRITTRALAAWAMSSGVPVLALVLVAVSALAEEDWNRDELALLVLVVGVTALIFGALALLLAARAIADPVIALRKAIHRVEEGELEADVDVDDGSEIGQLQAGFNSMLAGLRERERIQDLFGRHVGEEVAHAALESGVELGGETRAVAVLFADIEGSTRIAAERPPHEVVALLNRFFAIVVEVVRENGGWVNKFEGDAALAVFGAPVRVPDPAGAALAAGRELARRLDEEPDDLHAGIGVSGGEVVAGNIGEEQRFEYTVIGDPVNEAARLTELAKSREGSVLASERVIAAAGDAEAARWELGDAVELRGRNRETRVAAPKDAAGAARP